MTQDDIIRMAKESDAYWEHGDWNMPVHVGFYNEKNLIRFAKMIAAHEREAVLDLVDDYAKSNTDLRDAIRARGNT